MRFTVVGLGSAAPFAIVKLPVGRIDGTGVAPPSKSLVVDVFEAGMLEPDRHDPPEPEAVEEVRVFETVAVAVFVDIITPDPAVVPERDRRKPRCLDVPRAPAEVEIAPLPQENVPPRIVNNVLWRLDIDVCAHQNVGVLVVAGTRTVVQP